MLLHDDSGNPITESNPLPVQPMAGASDWTQTNDSAANTAVTITEAAVSGKTHYITAIEVTISGAAAANDITVLLQDGSTTKWKEVIGSGAPRGNRCGIVFNRPLKLTEGNAANLVVAAGGTGVIASANMAGYSI